jgi:hypothetical protein
MLPKLLTAVLAVIPLARGQRAFDFTAKIGVPVTESFQTGSFDFLATG